MFYFSCVLNSTKSISLTSNDALLLFAKHDMLILQMLLCLFTTELLQIEPQFFWAAKSG